MRCMADLIPNPKQSRGLLSDRESRPIEGSGDEERIECSRAAMLRCYRTRLGRTDSSFSTPEKGAEATGPGGPVSAEACYGRAFPRWRGCAERPLQLAGAFGASELCRLPTAINQLTRRMGPGSTTRSGTLSVAINAAGRPEAMNARSEHTPHGVAAGRGKIRRSRSRGQKLRLQAKRADLNPPNWDR